MTAQPIPDSAEEITPEWLSAVLNAHVTGVDAVPVTSGFVSTTLRLSLRFATPRTDLPKSLIVKFPHQDKAARKARRVLYEREAALYRDLGGELENVIPRHFFSAYDPASGRSAILMEDGAARDGVRLGDSLDGCTLAEAANAMRVLARIHARWWNDPDLRDLEWLPTQAESLPDHVHRLTDAWSRFPPSFRAQMSPFLVETVELYAPRAQLVAQQMSQEPWTLTHGDFRLDNLLFGPNTEVTVFDWQLITRGQGAADLPFFAMFSMTADKPIAETWQTLLEAYYAALMDSGVAYSQEEFAHDVRVNALKCIRTVVGGLANYDFSDARAQSLGEMWISRGNDMVELLDLPDLLREEFPLP